MLAGRLFGPRRLGGRQDAVTIVTFALIAPVLLFLIFGAAEMGRVLNCWMIITNEAREAARYGAVHYDSAADPSTQQTQIQSYLSQRLNAVLSPSGLYRAPNIQFVSPGGVNGSPMVQVTIYYQVDLVTPLISAFMPNPFPIAARSAMRGE